MNATDIITRFLYETNAQVYLEIGAGKVTNFSKVNAAYKIGIDSKVPNENIKSILDENCRYYQVASDDFFNNFEGISRANRKIDIVLVNGFHSYEQSLRDVLNSLRHLSEDGIIIIHDCKPTSEQESMSYDIWKERGSIGTWRGDVWKTIVHLRAMHKDLNIFVLDCDGGCGVISKGTPESVLNLSAEQIEKMEFKNFSENTTELLNLKPHKYLEEFIKSRKYIKSSELSKHLSEIFGGYVAAALAAKIE